MLRHLFSFAVALCFVPQTGGAQEKPGPLLDDAFCVCAVSLSRDGKLLLVAGPTREGGDWKIFDLATGKCKVDGTKGTIRCGGGAPGGHLSDDNALAALGGSGHSLFLVDVASGKLVCDLEEKKRLGATGQVLFTPDGKYLITSGGDSTIRVWDVQNRSAHSAFRYTALGPPGANGWLQPWFFEPARNLYEIKGRFSNAGSASAVLMPDGKVMAVTGNLDGEIPSFELATGKVVKTIKLKRKYASSLQFSADGKWLVAGGGGSRIRDDTPLCGSMEIWDVEKNELVAALGKHEGYRFAEVSSINHIAISPDKKTIASGGGDGFRVWDVATGKQKFSYFTKDDPRLPRVEPDFYPDGKPYVQQTGYSSGACFLPDGKTFMIAPQWTMGKTEIYFHDTATGELVDFRERVRALPAAKKAKDAPPK